jgi:prevent-host-death family protein
MKTYTVHTAKTHLSQLIDQACAGEEVVIAKGKNSVVKLVPVASTPHQRQFGAMRGKATVIEAFFEPLPDEELAVWEQ